MKAFTIYTSSFVVVVLIISLCLASSSAVASPVEALTPAASPAVPCLAETLVAAAKTLSDSGHLSMGLSLQLAASAGLALGSPTATIFTPPETAFVQSGPPSLPLLRLHVSPRHLSIGTLTRGTTIETLRPDYTLTVTSSLAADGNISVNGVRVDPDPIYDDGSVVIYCVATMLMFKKSGSAASVASAASTSCSAASVASTSASAASAASALAEPPFRSIVADVLRSRDCSIFAAFFEAQLAELTGSTLFAEVDDAVEEFANVTSDYSLLFRWRVVPKLMSFQDLLDMADQSDLDTFAEAKKLRLTKVDGEPVVNGDSVVIRPSILDTPSFKVHLLRSMRLRRRPGFFAGGCRKEVEAELRINTVSKVLNAFFGIITIGILVWSVILFVRNCIASFTDIPNAPPVPLNPAAAAAALQQQPMRPRTELDNMIRGAQEERAADMREDNAFNRINRAYHFTADYVWQVGVHFGMAYFLLRLFWSALESLDPRMHLGHGLNIGV